MTLKILAGSALLICTIGLVFISSNDGLEIEENLVEWNDKKVIASGDAYQGPWRMNDSEFHYVDDPAVATDDNGNITVVWANQKEQDLFLQRFNSALEPILESPQNISKSPGIFSWLPRIAGDTEDPDKIYILWQDIEFSGGSHGGEIIFARSMDGGTTFSEPINLSNTKAGAGKGRLSRMQWDNGSLDLAVGPKGEIYAVWTEYEGALMISRSNDYGENFSSPQRIDGDNEKPARAPSLAMDQKENLHLVWTVGEDPEADIRYSVSTDGGETFAEPALAFESNDHSDAPRIAVDREGTLHLVFSEGSGMRMGQYSVKYTRKFNDEEQFGNPVKVSSSHSGQVRSSGFPEIAINSNDQIFLLWELYTDRSPLPRGMGYTLSVDNGSEFYSPELLPGSADPQYGDHGSRQGSLMNRLALNGSGSVFVVNSTFLEGKSSHIWLNYGQVQH